MILGALIRSVAYALELGLYGLIVLLVLEWLVHHLPGPGLNPVRRALFKASYPLLWLGDHYVPLSLGTLDLRGLLVALGLWAVAKGFLPWLIWAGFVWNG
ncbi:MAG TPA: hypothetical protein VHE12_13985 [bacterium]|nr:hypothetical protein [bacterium]